VFKDALKSTDAVEFAGIATTMGMNEIFAGCETVTVLGKLEVDIRSTIGISKLLTLTDTSGAANQKETSVCACTNFEKNRIEIIIQYFLIDNNLFTFLFKDKELN